MVQYNAVTRVKMVHYDTVTTLKKGTVFRVVQYATVKMILYNTVTTDTDHSSDHSSTNPYSPCP